MSPTAPLSDPGADQRLESSVNRIDSANPAATASSHQPGLDGDDDAYEDLGYPEELVRAS